ncbi:AsmA family protein [Photobacterium galatheae]|uniref:AsmA family protein n=1 Tax=Photobacterium galatheae TaxID=1654360 RepID=UPI00202CDB0D|nr:AsmA family protein [Photobacterium galatheae]MCM0147418.1 AsmA family protein [Photobacterium galatheae]
MKKILYLLLAIVVVVVVGIGVLVTLVDPNQFKPLIAEQVKKATGRDLVMEGDISWRFFPSIGFDIGRTEFRNPEGFDEPNLVQFNEAGVSVSVLPLFSHQLEVGKVTLKDARVFIQTRKDGVSNLDGLTGDTASSAPQPQPQSQPESQPESQPQGSEGEPVVEGETATGEQWVIRLAGIALENASVSIRDDKAGTMTALDSLNLNLSQFAPGEWADFSFDLAGQNGAMRFTAQGKTGLKIAETLDNASLRNTELSASMTEAGTQLENVTVKLDQFTLGDWGEVSLAAKGQVPDLAFDASGKLRLMVNQDKNKVSVQGLDLNAALEGATLPRPTMTVGIAGDAEYDLKASLAKLNQFTLKADELALKGDASFKQAEIPVIRFDLSSDEINVDNWTGSPEDATAEAEPVKAEQSESEQESAPVASATPSDQEPDLSALKQFDVAGTVKVGRFVAANAKLSHVDLAIAIKDGVLDLNKFAAELYDGTIAAKARLDATGKLPVYQVSKTIKGVQVQPLLKDVADNDILAGTGNINVDVKGQGLAESRLKKNLDGTVTINFADGAVNGINIPKMIRDAKAKLKGKSDSVRDEAKKTDFSAMTATLVLKDGKASTDNMYLASPLLRVDGRGNTDLIEQTLDFQIDTSLVATSKGQGGKSVDEVADITVPLDITGTWLAPDYQINFKELVKRNSELDKRAKELKAKAKKEADRLEEKANKEVQRGLEKLLGDKAKDDKVQQAADKLLKGLFN